MFFALLGLMITTAVAIIGVVTSDQKNVTKLVLVLLTVSGFGVGIFAADEERVGKLAAEAEAKEAKTHLEKANQQLKELRTTIALVNVTVGDLAKLSELSGGSKYYVRIAADTSRSGLEPFLRKLQSAFRGSNASGMVAIREPKPGSRNYELVFGQGLDMAAAEVFHRLATSHRLPPQGQIAYIRPEPNTGM